jgi:hypothetical protein
MKPDSVSRPANVGRMVVGLNGEKEAGEVGLCLAAPAQRVHNPARRRLAVQQRPLPAHARLVVAHRQVEHLDDARKHDWQVGLPVHAPAVLLGQSSQQA